MKHAARAFTLIELLIASSIFVILMLAVYSTFNSGLFGYRNIDENINIYQTARSVLERFNRDLRNSFVYTSDDMKFSGKQNEINFLSLVDKFSSGKVMRHYAFISYKLEDGKLLRLCRFDKEALNDKSEVVYQELASNVGDFSLSYGFIEAVSQELKWKDTWDDFKSLPVVVKVKLIITGKAKQKFERTIYLP